MTEATIEIISPFGTETITLAGPATVHVNLSSLRDVDGNGREEVPTELVAMNLTGFSTLLSSPVTVRVRPETKSPFKPSRGRIEENVNSTPGVLDVEIVQTHLRADPALPLSSFERQVLAADAQTQQAFQTFLQQNQMSSFARIIGRKSSDVISSVGNK
jgi:hypothetical protein